MHGEITYFGIPILRNPVFLRWNLSLSSDAVESKRAAKLSAVGTA
jgi:hypothetical protein